MVTSTSKTKEYYAGSSKFYYKIEAIVLKPNSCTISGWVFNTNCNNVDVYIATEHIHFIDRISRNDVVTMYPQYNIGQNCGFSVTVDSRQLSNIKLIFKTIDGGFEYKIWLTWLRLKTFYNNISSTPCYLLFKIIQKNWLSETIKFLSNYTPLNNRNNKTLTTTPKISIILSISTFIAEHTLHDVLHGILNQSYCNYDLYIIDQSNNYKISKILQEYKSKSQPTLVNIKKSSAELAVEINSWLDSIMCDYVLFMTEDNVLLPNCLYEYVNFINCNINVKLIYCDEMYKFKGKVSKIEPILKPCFGIDTIRSKNYIGNSYLVKKDFLVELNNLSIGRGYATMYDLILRAYELNNNKEKNIGNIPKVLSYKVINNANNAVTTHNDEKLALALHLSQMQIDAEVSDGITPGIHRVKYKIKNNPLVSIIIPNKDQLKLLSNCIISIFGKTTYNNFEIIIIENNSKTPEIFHYYEEIKKQYSNLKVLMYNDEFNYSKINNFAIPYTAGEYLLFLNNDTEIITPTWIEEMLMLCQRDDVGVVGAKLLYPDNTVQHAGCYCGDLVAKHFFRGSSKDFHGLNFTANLTAVTGACIMMKKSVFTEINGFDEKFKVDLNDIDIILMILHSGYNIVYNPYVELYHFESKTRGIRDTNEKKLLFKYEYELFWQKWWKAQQNDLFCPYVGGYGYNQSILEVINR